MWRYITLEQKLKNRDTQFIVYSSFYVYVLGPPSQKTTILKSQPRGWPWLSCQEKKRHIHALVPSPNLHRHVQSWAVFPSGVTLRPIYLAACPSQNIVYHCGRAKLYTHRRSPQQARQVVEVSRDVRLELLRVVRGDHEGLQLADVADDVGVDRVGLRLTRGNRVAHVVRAHGHMNQSRGHMIRRVFTRQKSPRRQHDAITTTHLIQLRLFQHHPGPSVLDDSLQSPWDAPTTSTRGGGGSDTGDNRINRHQRQDTAMTGVPHGTNYSGTPTATSHHTSGGRNESIDDFSGTPTLLPIHASHPTNAASRWLQYDA